MLREGELDAVLVCTPPADLEPGQFLSTEPLPLMHPPDISPERVPLPGQSLTPEGGHCLRDRVAAACGMSFASADRHATGLELLPRMVAAGEGVSLVPALATIRLGKAEGLVVYGLPGPDAIAELVRVFRAPDLPLYAHRAVERPDGPPTRPSRRAS